MTREEANRILECMAIDLTGALSRTKEPMSDVLLQRLEAINVAQDVLTPQNEWISVAERLPRENMPILIYENNDTAVAVFMEKEFLEYSDTGYPVLIRRPTHWMPLPEPPKGEK